MHKDLTLYAAGNRWIHSMIEGHLHRQIDRQINKYMDLYDVGYAIELPGRRSPIFGV